MSKHLTSLAVLSSYSVRVVDEFRASHCDEGLLGVERGRGTSYCLFIAKLEHSGLLNHLAIAMVIEALESTCTECFNAESGCQCYKEQKGASLTLGATEHSKNTN